MTTLFLVLIVVVLVTCIGLNNISSRIGVPALLAFILLGILFGNIGSIPIYLDDPDSAREICTVALIFIMFYGGFCTRWESARPVVAEAGALASLGVFLTAALTGVFCHFALGWAWAESFLMGAVISSTDAASVFSILRSKRLGLKNNSAPIVEVESGSNDPCAYMFTAVMISVVNGTATAGSVLWMVFAQIVFGAGIGWVIGRLALLSLQRMHFATKGFDTLLLLAIAIASYAVPDLVGGNGYLSAYIVGIMVGNEDFPGKKAMIGFFDGLTGLMQVLIFFLLGLLARPAQLVHAFLPALAIFVFLLLVARPVAVSSILAPLRKYPFRQQVLVSFVGLRGASSIVFAIMALTGVAGLSVPIFDIVFSIVLVSMLFQGSFIPLAAHRLDMIDANADVMKTFNDYSEDSEMQFGHVEVAGNCSWAGKKIGELGLPRDMLIVLIIRDGVQILPLGNTQIREGDEVVTLTRTFDDKAARLYEKTVKTTSRRVGQPIKKYPGDGLVVLVLRGDERIIPSGDTILYAGDRLVLLRV